MLFVTVLGGGELKTRKEGRTVGCLFCRFDWLLWEYGGGVEQSPAVVAVVVLIAGRP